MDQEELLELWNAKRQQIIMAQISPALVLIAVFVSAAFGAFENASDAVRYLTVGVAAITGFLAVITQYAAIREAQALVIDLNQMEKRSALATKIGESGTFLTLTAAAVVLSSLVVFALVIWAVLG